MMYMKNQILTTILCATICINTYATDYYSGKVKITCGDIEYVVEEKDTYIWINNVTNYRRNEAPYRRGSNPREYYKDGYHPYPEVKENYLKEIVNAIFSEEEKLIYKQYKGFLDMGFVINPDNGVVWEIQFFLHQSKEEGVDGILGIPVEKLAALEKMCVGKELFTITDEVRKANMSYCTGWYSIFFNISKKS